MGRNRGQRRARAIRWVGAALFVLGVTAAAAPAASAVTHRAATKVALRALSPRKLKGPVRVFSLPAPVPRGQFVYEAGLTGTQRVRRLPFPVWLYWEDQAAGAEFAHSSVLLLINARTGKVVTRRKMLWLLYVGRHPALFLRTQKAYDSKRYIVYSNRAAGRAHATATARAGGGGYERAINRKAALAHDCLVTIGDFAAREFEGDRVAIDAFADAVGLRRFDVPTTDASVGGLRRTVETAHNSGCTDVFLFIAGHGRFPSRFWEGGSQVVVRSRLTGRPAGQPPGVNVHPLFRLDKRNGKVEDNSSYITPQALVDLVKPYSGSFGHVDFKIKIDSCFAGRFQTEGHVDAQLNVVAVEFAARADETGWFFEKGAVEHAASPATHRFTNVELNNEDIPNPDRAASFTNGNVAGLFDWAAHAPQTDSLLDGILSSLERGRSFDFARVLNYTHPYVVAPHPPAFQPALSVFPIDPGDDGLFSIAAGRGPGGHSRHALVGSVSIAFAETSSAKIGLMDTSGDFTTVSTAPGKAPQQITYGPDGNFWFTEIDVGNGFHDAIGRITPAGAVSTFDLPETVGGASIGGIAAGPDGNLWFTETTNARAGGGTIGVVSTSGALLHEYAVPSTGAQFFQLFLITKGPDGNMWFTESGPDVGRITMSGQVTQFPISPSGQPFGIAAGPDGRVWMAVQVGPGAVGRINTNGTGYTEFRDPDGGFPNQIAAGPDGSVWYVDHANGNQGGNQIGRVTPSGQITEYSVGLPADSLPTAITASPDGRMWFTLSGANDVGAITTR